MRTSDSCDQLFFIYTGARRRFLGNPIEFLMRTRLLDRNLVLFADPHTAYYHKGISTAVGTFAAFVEWQRAFVASMPHVRHVFCLGTSMGGYAALLCGHLLRAEEVWAFAPATQVSPRDPDMPADYLDLRHLLLRRPNGTTRYHVYYNRSFSKDRGHALRLLGCDGVALQAMDGDGHNVLHALDADDRLETLFPATLPDDPAERSDVA